jgi:hypothetical protein
MSRMTTLGLVIAAALAIVATLTVNTALSSPTTNATTTVSNMTSASPIYEQHSEAHSNRVIDVTNGSAKLEVSYSGNGFAKSIYTVTDQGSILYTLQSAGAVNGTGRGYIRSLDGEMVTYTLKGGGQMDKEGNTSFQGTIHFNTIPSGNLAFLSNMKGTFKAEASNKGQITFQVWQQK